MASLEEHCNLFFFYSTKNALNERSLAIYKCLEALKQIAGSNLCVLDISTAPRE